MKRFAALFEALDATTKTSVKTAALTAYFQTAPEQDRVWTIALLSGKRPKRAATSTELRAWAAGKAGLPLWLVEETYPIVGDLAETIALILPPPHHQTDRSLTDWISTLVDLTGKDAETRRAGILSAWDGLSTTERFLFNKLITGGFRMGVSRGLMTRALAAASGVEESQIAHRLMGNWAPATTSYDSLIAPQDESASSTRPYPFALASALEGGPDALGDIQDWAAEWKWDGIRAQVIARPGAFAIWSRGEELITDSFPDLEILARALPPGTVIDAEIVAWGEAGLQPFAALQKRIGRKTVSKKLLAEAPVRLIAYDLLEAGGKDLRATAFADRRAQLEALVDQLPAGAPMSASALVAAPDWDGLATQRAKARDHLAEGLMLKRKSAAYHLGRKRGDWWKWKLDPHTVDAVMIYAQSGHGRRATLFTDFTFALRDGDDLVPFAKAYSGLTDAEFREITAWVKAHTLEKFGPVRRVPPDLVFELAFEGIQQSPRHKSGIALRFPRMLRWRRDKPASEIDTMDSLRALLEGLNGSGPQ
jgi:DNA ligase 1